MTRILLQAEHVKKYFHTVNVLSFFLLFYFHWITSYYVSLPCTQSGWKALKMFNTLEVQTWYAVGEKNTQMLLSFSQSFNSV